MEFSHHSFGHLDLCSSCDTLKCFQIKRADWKTIHNVCFIELGQGMETDLLLAQSELLLRERCGTVVCTIASQQEAVWVWIRRLEPLCVRMVSLGLRGVFLQTVQLPATIQRHAGSLAALCDFCDCVNVFLSPCVTLATCLGCHLPLTQCQLHGTGWDRRSGYGWSSSGQKRKTGRWWCRVWLSDSATFSFNLTQNAK